MDSIFTNIQSHVNWKKSEPEENMFTSVMSAVLDRVKSFREAFLSEVLGKKLMTKYKVLTQAQLPLGIIPDIMFVSEDGKTKILIENKLGAVLGKGQLNNYIKYIDKNKDTEIKLVVISYYDEDLLLNNKSVYKKIHNLKWSKVYKITEKCLTKETSHHGWYLLSEFKKYMEDNNMAPFSGLKPSDINAVAFSKALYFFATCINKATKRSTKVKRVERFGAYGYAEDNAGIFTSMKIKKKYTVYFGLYFQEGVAYFNISVYGPIEKNIKLKRAFVHKNILKKKINFEEEEGTKSNYVCYTKFGNMVNLHDKNGKNQEEKFIKNVEEIIKILKKIL